MDDRISRRRLLSTAAAGSLTVGVAGCLDGFGSESSDDDDATTDAGSGPENGDDDPADEDESYATACEAGTGFLETTFEGEFEAAGEYYPHEYLEEYDREFFVDYLEGRFAHAVDNYDLTAANCAESTDDHDVIEAARDELDVEVTAGEWLTYELDLETDGETASELMDVLALEIEGTWYAGVVDVSGQDTEVTVEIAEDDQLIDADADGKAAEVVVSVIDEDGEIVPGATVIATDGSALLEDVLRAETGAVPDDLEGAYDDLEDHQAVLNFDGRQSLRDDQDMGTIELDIVPPSDTNYIDEQPNPDIRVVRN
ncbi:DUF7382 domain-containing protein [Natronorubrum texcoconense]|uniref:DUF7382 domain-containing protein n=1 Tax=Natronorubrum texcoconense TaxID=1095776 RepID=A0A1G9EPJ9_9EURY|nr:hypothetical protein [Natronorubrum texcoconense]SDK78034.1 hypothetical protein SAMN04515672_3921 [Natronorubrum texcoconense]